MRTALDQKNIELAKLVFRLRQDVDLYRVIGVNAGSLREHGVSENYWAHLQMLAHESIVMLICKIYEQERRRYSLNSIPGILKQLDFDWTSEQVSGVRRFCRGWSCRDLSSVSLNVLASIVDEFSAAHEAGFTRLKEFRDKFAAHSETGAIVSVMPSLDQFETLWRFADGFYRMVSESFLEVGPGLMPLYVQSGLLGIFRKLGIHQPLRDVTNQNSA